MIDVHLPRYSEDMKKNDVYVKISLVFHWQNADYLQLVSLNSSIKDMHKIVLCSRQAAIFQERISMTMVNVNIILYLNACKF